MTLPVLVDCRPYSATLRSDVCVDRWRQANGQTEKLVAGINMSRCNGCETGDARSRAQSAQGEAMQKCPKCGEERQRLERMGDGTRICRKCKIGGTSKTKTVTAPTARVIKEAERAISPVTEFIGMLETRRSLESRQMQERELLADRQRGQRELADKLIADFETKNPGIRAQAAALLAGGDKPDETRMTGPETCAVFDNNVLCRRPVPCQIHHSAERR